MKGANFSLAVDPRDAASFAVSEDAILDFLFREEFNRESEDTLRQLTLNHVSLTPNFFSKLVKVR